MEIDFVVGKRGAVKRYKSRVCFGILEDRESSSLIGSKFIKWRPSSKHVEKVEALGLTEVYNKYLERAAEVYPEVRPNLAALSRYGVIVDVRKHTYWYVLAAMSWPRRMYEEVDTLGPTLKLLVQDLCLDIDAAIAWSSYIPMCYGKSYYHYPGHFCAAYHRDFAHSYKNALAIEEEYLNEIGPCSARLDAPLDARNPASCIISGTRKPNPTGRDCIPSFKDRVYKTPPSGFPDAVFDFIMSGVGYQTVYSKDKGG